ncbi:TPA: hypothetical protein I8W28_000299 [Corynebacterium striatum]|uniref:hypothetical protein n=1 Tax=Corynebacterium TaxID=1716 RepID=UPI0011C740DF|nr:hypothetical protein [Corynebacterium sp. LK14]HAT1303623.1 hypothetical protein [Corynebacterium striatum]TXS64610.1 hypothetical protein CHU71_04295 [Corynebacterium sp. LK14]HAT1362168.1 hypothetical protein [Corynebacterium striatum]HAT1365324.1 hypothetical protein [Corynebacterium striatum]HAT1392324.1 hypothetical protein [Corynebacterium striatum]
MPNMTPEEARRVEALNAGGVGVDRAASTICDLSGQIAGMTYEYGVQIGTRLYVRPGICTKYPDRAWWTSKPSEAHAVAVKAREKNTHPVRLVLRLVSQPEEVKP